MREGKGREEPQTKSLATPLATWPLGARYFRGTWTPRLLLKSKDLPQRMVFDFLLVLVLVLMALRRVVVADSKSYLRWRRSLRRRRRGIHASFSLCRTPRSPRDNGNRSRFYCYALRHVAPLKYTEYNQLEAGHSIECITHAGHSIAFLHFLTV